MEHIQNIIGFFNSHKNKRVPTSIPLTLTHANTSYTPRYDGVFEFRSTLVWVQKLVNEERKRLVTVVAQF